MGLFTMFSPFTTSLCFRFVSPSRLAVSMWHTEFVSLVFNNKISAGMLSSLLSLTKSPTTTFFQAIGWYSSASLEKITNIKRVRYYMYTNTQ